MAKIKKAQRGDKVPKGYVRGEMTDRLYTEKEYRKHQDEFAKSLQQMKEQYKKDTSSKKPVVKKKMKDGGKAFPDLNKDGKITKADILKGRGVIKNGGKLKAKAGAAVKKKAMGGAKMMKGGGKCKYGC